MSIGKKLKDRRKELGLTLEEVASQLGITRQTLSRYENNKIYNIPIARLQSLAEILKIDTNTLLKKQNTDVIEIVDYTPNNRIPILGHISAGLPLYAEENIEGYIFSDIRHDGEYFALRVKGDSMNAAHIFEGNLLIVRKQDMIENGEIAVVLIDEEEATVKRFYCEGKTVTLMPQSTNPKHIPQIYDTTKVSVRIVGKVIKSEITFE